MTVLAARCIDAGKATTKEEVKDAYMPLYYIIAIITGFLVISLIFLIGSDESYKKETESIKNVKDIEKDQPQPQIQEATPIIPKQKQLYTLLTTSSFVYVLLLSLTIGFSNSIYSMLRGIYVEEMILFMSPNKKLIASLTAITGMAFEVIIYFFGKSLLTKFGAFTMLSISLIMICARSWGYFFIPESEQYIWVIFILELFCRGVCIGSFSISSVHIASQVAGPDLQATAQGLVHAVVNGLAGILGSVVSAVVLKVTASYKVVFLVASVAPSVAFLGLVVFKWFEWVGSRKCK